jgi:hypothetical protein
MSDDTTNRKPVFWGTCFHVAIGGPRIPRVYGSGSSDVCTRCGAWRPTWFAGAGWRAPETLADAMKNDD